MGEVETLQQRLWDKEHKVGLYTSVATVLASTSSYFLGVEDPNLFLGLGISAGLGVIGYGVGRYGAYINEEFGLRYDIDKAKGTRSVVNRIPYGR